MAIHEGPNWPFEFFARYSKEMSYALGLFDLTMDILPVISDPGFTLEPTCAVESVESVKSSPRTIGSGKCNIVCTQCVFGA